MNWALQPKTINEYLLTMFKVLICHFHHRCKPVNSSVSFCYQNKAHIYYSVSPLCEFVWIKLVRCIQHTLQTLEPTSCFVLSVSQARLWEPICSLRNLQGFTRFFYYSYKITLRTVIMLVSCLKPNQWEDDLAEGQLNHFNVITLYQQQPSGIILHTYLFNSKTQAWRGF